MPTDPHQIDVRDVNEALGKKLAALRTATGLSQAAVARRLAAALGRPVDPSTYSRMEQGKRPLMAAEIVALVGILGIDPAALFPDKSPLGALQTHWHSIRAAKQLDVDQAGSVLRAEEFELRELDVVLSYLNALADFRESSLVTSDLIDAVSNLRLIIRNPDDTMATLIDCGFSRELLAIAQSETDEWLGPHSVQPSSARWGYFVSRVAMRLRVHLDSTGAIK